MNLLNIYPLSKPMYEEKLQKLRDAGVIDMEKNEGCIVKFKSQPIRNKDKILRYFGQQESKIIYANYDRLFMTEWKGGTYTVWESYFADMYEDYDGNGGLDRFLENLGHDLLYGRVCRWLKENRIDIFAKAIKPVLVPGIPEIGVAPSIEHRKSIIEMLFVLWSHLDKPLSQQENKEEIVDFICSLLPSK